MQYETVYPNIYKCVSDYIKIHHDRFWTFTDTLRTRQDSWGFRTNKWEQCPKNMQIVQIIIWLILIYFRQKRLPRRSVSDCLRLLNCLYRKNIRLSGTRALASPPSPSDAVLPEKHERILRRIIRRFGGFPTRTYSNRISNDVNVRITYEECSGRVLNLNKTCA